MFALTLVFHSEAETVKLTYTSLSKILFIKCFKTYFADGLTLLSVDYNWVLEFILHFTM